MSVHKDITKHVEEINKRVTDFMALDQKREEYIEEAVQLCKQGKSFSTEKINEVTRRMNDLAKQGTVPSRKMVTPEMVRDYVSKIQ